MTATEDARAACDSSRWGDAWRLLSEVDLDALDVDDLDRRATAAFLTGRHADAFAAWTRAYQRCLDEGSVHRAASFGARIAEALGFMGDLARCRGWVDRGTDLLGQAGIDCVEQGYLEHGLGMMRLFEAGDIAGAHAHFVQAGKIAAQYAHRELATLAHIAEGRMLIYLGDLAEGMALLDGAMVSIEAGDLSPLATGDAYCTVIDACSELYDLERCRSWTDSFTRWCATQQELVLYRGHCFLHTAEVLGHLGRWPEALDQARHALRAPGRTRPPHGAGGGIGGRGRPPAAHGRPRRRRGLLHARQRARARPAAGPRAPPGRARPPRRGRCRHPARPGRGG